MRDIVILSAIVAVFILVFHIILGTPVMTRVRESFATQRVGATVTRCPAGTQMYMHGGGAYCCSGTIDPDASTVAKSCRPLLGRNDRPTFCTLGSASPAAPNCLSLRSGMMSAMAATVCPPAAPNYVKSADGPAKCCASAATADYTDCVAPAGSCAVSDDPNEFKDAGACQFLKAKQEAPACPASFSPFTAAGANAMSAISLFGCTDNGSNCYAESTLQRLKELGYDVGSLTSCSKV